MSSIFFDGPEAYNREYDFVNYAIQDYSNYISKLLRLPFDTAKAKVKEIFNNHEKLKLINPKVRYLERLDNGDRVPVVEPFSTYFKKIQDRKYILSPSMIAYASPEEEEAKLAVSTAKRLALRKKEKNLQQDYKALGDIPKFLFYNGSQTSRKISVNSISGATLSPHNAYYNPSAHTTMTSTCRITTAHANANNERLLGGNRHFDTIPKALENIINTCSLIDRSKLQKAIGEFNLHIPSVEEMMVAVLRSTRMYLMDPEGEREIYRLVKTLDPLERAGWCYSGDLYHVMKFNPSFMREWFDDAIAVDFTIKVEDPKHVIKNMPSSMFELAAVISQELFIDRDIVDEKGKPKTYTLKTLEEERPERYLAFAQTIISCVGAMHKRLSFINAFLKNDCAPAYVGYLPSMTRRVVLGSDTDSSMATGQHWTKWYTGEAKFDKIASKALAVVVYFSSETLVHYLAHFSANMNIPKQYLYRIAMKNEFMYTAYVRSTAAKHYYSNVKVCEGVVYPEEEFDVKGVQLIAGKLPKDMQKELQTLQQDILENIGAGRSVPVRKYAYKIASLEQQLIQELKAGHVDRLRFEKVKSEAEYSDPGSQTWFYHDLWNNVFAGKYGEAPQPPYLGVSLTVGMKTKTKFMNWIESIDDPAMKLAVRNHWNKWSKKPGLERILLPLENVNKHGIPVEIQPALSTREIVLKTMQPFYLTMETIGAHVYRNKGENITLFSDLIQPEALAVIEEQVYNDLKQAA